MSTLDEALSALAAGKPVLVPTETVYGVAVDGTSAAAVEALYTLRGRPPTKPMSLMVHPQMELSTWARIDARTRRLIEAFWPGPLTVVVPCTDAVPDVVTAGQPTVGLRAPDHPLTLELLERFGRPLAAPSANRAGEPAPRTAEGARAALPVDVVLDGGPCRTGVASTVAMVSPVIRVFREGPLSAADLEAALRGR